MKLSVLMPFRNAASTLPEALTTIMEAMAECGPSSVELVAVDHGSNDQSAQVIEGQSNSAFHVNLIDASSAPSLAEALELGRHHCKGEYIARMDADDRMDPQRLRADISYLDRHQDVSAIACCIAPFADDQEKPALPMYATWQNGILSPEAIATEIWIEQPLCHPATTFRADALSRIGGYRHGDFPEDYDLFMRMHVAGDSLHKRPEIHHHWRQHQGQSTANDPRYHRDAFARVKARGLRDFFSLDVRPFAIAGAGREGGRIARALAEIGLTPRWFFDVSEKKIGSVRYGVGILSYDQLDDTRRQAPDMFCIGAVGTSGSGAIVRNRFRDAGFIECENFVLVA